MPSADRAVRYREVIDVIASLSEHETDWISVLSTTACELHHAFEHFHWTGFYRVTAPSLLSVGPYQGGHGCLQIAFSRGICGRAARTKTLQWIRDVNADPEHIACASTTQAEVVVPITTREGKLLAVLDIDSNDVDAFVEADINGLREVASLLAIRAAQCGMDALP